MTAKRKAASGNKFFNWKFSLDLDKLILYILFGIIIILFLLLKCSSALSSTSSHDTVIKYRIINIPTVQKEHEKQTVIERIIYKTEKPETVYVDTSTQIPIDSLPKLTLEPMIQLKYNYSRKLLGITTIDFQETDSGYIGNPKTRIYSNVNPVFQATSLKDSVSVLSKRYYSEIYTGVSLVPSVYYSNLKSVRVTPEVYFGYSLNSNYSAELFTDIDRVGIRVSAKKKFMSF